MKTLDIASSNDPIPVFDHHFTIRCPHCQAKTNLSAVSFPRHEIMVRFKPKRLIIGYRCDACNDAVALRFGGSITYGNPVKIPSQFEELERPTEDFEMNYLPEPVRTDFAEALTCFSQSCFNAFAAMCRRSIQSTAVELGSAGSTKVQSQLDDLESMGVVDEEAYKQLHAVMLGGHDGAHPHLPPLSPERATVLLELMKDVLYQLFVRKAKIKEAADLRNAAIEEHRDP